MINNAIIMIKLIHCVPVETPRDVEDMIIKIISKKILTRTTDGNRFFFWTRPIPIANDKTVERRSKIIIIKINPPDTPNTLNPNIPNIPKNDASAEINARTATTTKIVVSAGLIALLIWFIGSEERKLFIRFCLRSLSTHLNFFSNPSIFFSSSSILGLLETVLVVVDGFLDEVGFLLAGFLLAGFLVGVFFVGIFLMRIK